MPATKQALNAKRRRFQKNRVTGSTLPMCVGCLSKVGWGIKRIIRHTGYAKTSVHRFMKFHGLADPQKSLEKKHAEIERRRRLAAQRSAEKLKDRIAEISRRKAERAAMPKQSDAQRRAKALAYYYKHHEKLKERSRSYMSRMYDASDKDSEFRIKLKLRSRIHHAIKQGGGIKPARTMEITGCTVQQLKAWLETQFRPRMSWANFGHGWHIDHVLPCASFDLSDKDQVRQCFHYTNLRPLWAKENLRKSDTITEPQLMLLLPAV